MRPNIYACINRLFDLYSGAIWFVKRKTLFASLGKVGRNVRIGRQWSIPVPSNIFIGNDVSIGEGVRLSATSSKIVFKDHVLLGPEVSMHGGNHRVDIVGRTIKSVGLTEKRPGIDDADIVIEEDVWIGNGAKIMKGVTVGRGCVIGANAVITKNTIPYGIYGGVNKLLKMRFTKGEIIEHEKLLNL